jgi:glycosyltransferase involved in cell wall biosynthesis
MKSPFSYPARPGDAVLAVAGEAERLVRAVLRRSGLRKFRAGTSPSPSPKPDAGEAGRSVRISPLEAGSPILYLPAVAWRYRVQRPQHLALALARAGHPVLYVDGFLRSRLLPARRTIEVRDGVHVLRVRVPGRPDPYREVLDRPGAERLADVLLAGLGSARPAMVFVQLPFWVELGEELARRLGVPLVYDRIDLHAGFPGVPLEIEAAEIELLREADLVCATSSVLVELPRSLGARVLLLPNAVDLAAFRGPAARAPRTEVRIGYVGALGPWFDAEAVRAAALALPGWRFRLAGRVEDAAVAALNELPNVELPGEIPFREVPGFLAGMDAALVPFKDSPLTRAVDPVKLYEALALGLPVVARRLPETERWASPLVYLYETPEDFVLQARRAVEEDSPERAAERRRAAEGESWNRRAAQLLGLMLESPGCSGRC